jgi:hypothetical protein
LEEEKRSGLLKEEANLSMWRTIIKNIYNVR